MIRCCGVVTLVHLLIIRMSQVVVVAKSSPGYEVVRIAISGLCGATEKGEAINFSCNYIVSQACPFTVAIEGANRTRGLINEQPFLD